MFKQAAEEIADLLKADGVADMPIGVDVGPATPSTRTRKFAFGKRPSTTTSNEESQRVDVALSVGIPKTPPCPHWATSGVAAVSSCFFFVLPDGRPLVYGDCGVLPEPTAEQMAAVAVSSAATFAQLTGDEPAVAMLSFSNFGSNNHPAARRVRRAVE